MMLCSCIAEPTIAACMRRAKDAHTALIEHRIDHLNQIEGLEAFYNTIPQPVIATMRPTWEGGRSTLGDDGRMEVLAAALSAGCAAVDVELETTPRLRAKLLQKAANAHAISIVSHHNFEGTPSLDELIMTHAAAVRAGADIVKIITTAHTPEDCATIEALMKYGAQTHSTVAFAMGDEGTRTRATALIFGAPFMYVSLGSATASGQTDASTLMLLVGRCTV